MKRARRLLRPVVERILSRRYPRRCPVCGRFAKAFRPFGLHSRPDAQCPTCGALERHRLVWLFLTRRTDLMATSAPRRLLHVAPERQIGPLLARLPQLVYTSADLAFGRVALRLDLARLPFPSATFGAVVCNHVLEHVPDDRAAMRELRRVLEPGGWAILQVPIRGPYTLEDASVRDPRERERLFGQQDHVRQYGRDYVVRLESAGFAVDAVPYTEELPAREVTLYGLKRQTIYFCRASVAPPG